MNIADYESHVSIDSLVSGTKTDDWTLHVFLPVDPDFTYIRDLILTQAQVTRTLLTLTWALMSQTCAWTSMIWTQSNIYNINHIWLASFLKHDYWGPGPSQPELHKTDELGPELTGRHRNSVFYKTLLQWSTLLTSDYEGILMTVLIGFVFWAKTTF